MPPFSAIDYRRYAAECVRLAQSTSNPLDKARLLDMVETFSLAEKHEATDPGTRTGDLHQLPFFRRDGPRLFP